MSTTIRVSQRTRTLVQDLARDDGLTMQETVELAVEAYRRQRMLRETNAAYAAVRADAMASAELDEEIAAWDGTLDDGLVGL